MQQQDITTFLLALIIVALVFWLLNLLSKIKHQKKHIAILEKRIADAEPILKGVLNEINKQKVNDSRYMTPKSKRS